MLPLSNILPKPHRMVKAFVGSHRHASVYPRPIRSQPASSQQRNAVVTGQNSSSKTRKGHRRRQQRSCQRAICLPMARHDVNSGGINFLPGFPFGKQPAQAHDQLPLSRRQFPLPVATVSASYPRGAAHLLPERPLQEPGNSSRPGKVRRKIPARSQRRIGCRKLLHRTEIAIHQNL